MLAIAIYFYNHIKFISLDVHCGSTGIQNAILEIEIDGYIKKTSSNGQGPVDAVFNCINKLVPNKAKLSLYQVNAITKGTDAQAEVTVKLEQDDKSFVGKGADLDTLVASARAYISALNRLMVKREKNVPEEIAN